MSDLYFAKFDSDFEQVKTIRNRREYYTRMEAQIASLLDNMGQVLAPETIKKLRAQQQRLRERLCWCIHEGNCPAQSNTNCPALPSTSAPINTQVNQGSDLSEDSMDEEHQAIKPSTRVVRAEKNRVYEPRVEFRNSKKPLFHRV